MRRTASLQVNKPNRRARDVCITWVVLVAGQEDAQWLQRRNAAGASILWTKHEQHLERGRGREMGR